MRYTVLVATLALAVLAAPVPEPETVEARAIRNEGLSHGARPKGSTGKREPLFRAGGRRHAELEPVVHLDEGEDNVEARAIRNEGLSHGVKPKGSNSRRESLYRSNGKREPSVRGKESRNAVNRIIAVRGEDRVDINPDYQLPNTPEMDIDVRSAEPINRINGREPEPINRINGREPKPINRINGREPEPINRINSRDVNNKDGAEDIQARVTRNEGKRSVREKTVSVEDVEARAIRNEGKRSVREKIVAPDGNIEARAIRNEGKRSVREKTVSVEDVEARAIKNQRRSPALSRPKNTRDDDQEENDNMEASGYTRPSDKRDPEPMNRINGN